MQYVGTPLDQIEGMRNAPVFSTFEALAPTLAYDAADLGKDAAVPIHSAAHIKVPTLVINGTVIPFMLTTAVALSNAIPGAQHCTLEGQSHDVNLEVLAPVLLKFFSN